MQWISNEKSTLFLLTIFVIKHNIDAKEIDLGGLLGVLQLLHFTKHK